MSEYAARANTPKSIDQLDNTGTLFEDAIERDVDTKNISYYDARLARGLDTSTTLRSSQESEAVWVVSVDDRALALEAIMAYLNKANQTNGSKTHLEHGGQQMRQRYGEPWVHDVQQGAEVNRDHLRPGFIRGIEVLAGTDQLRSMGVDEASIEVERMRVQVDINNHFGVGNAYAPTRNKVAKAARSSADSINGRKKPRRGGK